MRGEAGGANTGDYVDARHSSDPKKKRPLGRFVMKQVAGYGGMCRQSSTFKADERSAGRVDRDFDGGCGTDGWSGRIDAASTSPRLAVLTPDIRRFGKLRIVNITQIAA